MATQEETARVKEMLRTLTPEQKAELLEMIRQRKEATETTAMSRSGRPLRPFQGQEQTDIGYTDNPLADATATGMGALWAGGTAAAPIVGALAGGGGAAGALSAAAPLATRAAIGAGVGGVLGSTPLPIVGNVGAKEGALTGAAFAVGQARGALWRHHKKQKALTWMVDKIDDLVKKFGRKEADDIVKALSDDVATLPPGMSGTATSFDDVAAAAKATPKAAPPAPAMPAASSSPATTTMPKASAPAPVTPKPTSAVAEGMVQRVKDATAAAKEFGLKAGSKVHNITAGGRVLQWFPTPDKARGALARLVKEHGLVKSKPGVYKAPDGTIIKLDWTIAGS